MTVGIGELSVVRRKTEVKSMSSNICVWVLATFLLTTVYLAEAQQTKKVLRIAYLGGGSAELEKAWLDAFLHGLRELGYFEDKTSSWNGAMRADSMINYRSWRQS